MNKDINVTPDLEPTSNLGPFKFFALTNFPYIEQTFDTLTNYELMCKMAEELNKFIKNNNATNTNVINLYNAFVSLQDYVNQYFDELNVQNEVNTKLDQMASDGTLATIINENIFNELNTNLENLTNKVGNETLPSADSSVSQNINLLNNKIGDETLPNPEESIIANINSLNEDINSIKNALFLGDSFGAGWASGSEPTKDQLYPKMICDKLNYNCYNYCVGGAGFVVTNNTLLQQLNQFKNENPTINPDFIFIHAGYNDFQTESITASQVGTAFNTLINTINDYYPNTTIYLIPITFRNNNWNSKATSMCHYLINNARNYDNIVIIKNAYLIYIGRTADTSDNVHPTLNTEKIFANYIINKIKGGSDYEYCDALHFSNSSLSFDMTFEATDYSIKANVSNFNVLKNINEKASFNLFSLNQEGNSIFTTFNNVPFIPIYRNYAYPPIAYIYCGIAAKKQQFSIYFNTQVNAISNLPTSGIVYALEGNAPTN